MTCAVILADTWLAGVYLPLVPVLLKDLGLLAFSEPCVQNCPPTFASEQV